MFEIFFARPRDKSAESGDFFLFVFHGASRRKNLQGSLLLLIDLFLKNYRFSFFFFLLRSRRGEIFGLFRENKGIMAVLGIGIYDVGWTEESVL